MNQVLARIRQLLASRSERERWVLGLGLLAVALIVVEVAVLRPLRARAGVREAEVAQLTTDVEKARRLASGIQRLQAEVQAVSARITPGAKTNLLTLLETIAEQARVKDRLDSIKPKQATGNSAFPETRVELVLKGATLEQVVQLLYRIETASVHLIIRSIRMKSRSDGSNLLDVSLSVSSFEKT